MAFMNWDDRLSVGVKALDEQHKVLVESVNKLHTAMLKGQARSVVGELLNTLAKYTVDHFATEEKLMISTQYPDLALHKLQHQELTRQVGEHVARFDKGDITLSVGLLNFLSDWLVNHIQGDDKKYGPWLNSHGVK